MPATLETPLMTTAELLALPDDGVERWLINGQLRESRTTPPDPDRKRELGADGLKVKSHVAELLERWLKGSVQNFELCSDATSLRVEADRTELVVDFQCPGDTYGELWARLDKHRKAGVPLVWIVDPGRQTIMVIRQDRDPELVTITQELTAEPHLPGFKAAVKEIFA